MTKLHDALEICLEALERGESIDAALARYPDLEARLRPLLAASATATSSSDPHIPAEVQRRGRARLLQHAAELAESRTSNSRRAISLFPRLALTAGLVAALVLTSTGLVSASSGSLPGQQLYPVKRTWESLRLWFVFNPEERDLLESDFEQERLNEIDELLGRQMSAPISFSGLLTKRSDGNWVISGIPVSVSATTKLPATAFSDGAPVSVTGTTRLDGLVQAGEIQLLQPGSSLPPLEPSEIKVHPTTGRAPLIASPTPGAAQPNPAATVPAQITYQFSGVVQSMQGSVWRINGQPVYLDNAQITGQVQVGSIVRFTGFYSDTGKFIVTILQAKSGGSDSKQRDTGGRGSDDSSGGSGGGDDSGGGNDGP